MSGTITRMSDNQQNVTNDVPQNNDEIVGIYMVPARLLDKYRAQFQDKEFTIDSLIVLRIYGVARKGQVQSKRIVWKTHDIQLKQVISYVEELSAPPPHKQ